MKTEQVQKTEKPIANLLGEDSNVFNIVGIASKALKKAGMGSEASEMATKVFASGSYDEALTIIGNYVEIQ